MKKLLLLTNIACICFLFASCQNSQKTNSELMNDKVLIQDSVLSSDTTKTEMRIVTSDSVVKEPGIKKDSTKSPIKSKAIIHGAPNQERIDSIKNAKQKGKK